MSRRRRGFVTEELVAEALRADGWPNAETPPRGAAGPDILGTPGIRWEIKARRGFDVGAAMRQAAGDASGAVPVVIMRPDGFGPASIDLWPLIVPFGEGRRLLRLAGYGERPIELDEETELTTPGDYVSGVRVFIRADGSIRREPIGD